VVLTDLRQAIARHAGEIHGRILDYGCGTKPYIELFQNATEYVGADFATNPYADIFLDETGKLPEDATGFDCVVSFQVLEHVPNVQLYLAECRRALKGPGSQLLPTTHGIWEYHPSPLDYFRWTHEGLMHTIEQAGFETHVIEPVTGGSRALLQLAAIHIERRWPLPRVMKRLLFRTINGLATLCYERQESEIRMADLPICYLYSGSPKGGGQRPAESQRE